LCLLCVAAADKLLLTNFYCQRIIIHIHNIALANGNAQKPHWRSRCRNRVACAITHPGVRYLPSVAGDAPRISDIVDICGLSYLWQHW